MERECCDSPEESFIDTARQYLERIKTESNDPDFNSMESVLAQLSSHELEKGDYMELIDQDFKTAVDEKPCIEALRTLVEEYATNGKSCSKAEEMEDLDCAAAVASQEAQESAEELLKMECEDVDSPDVPAGMDTQREGGEPEVDEKVGQPESSSLTSVAETTTAIDAAEVQSRNTAEDSGNSTVPSQTSRYFLRRKKIRSYAEDISEQVEADRSRADASATQVKPETCKKKVVDAKADPGSSLAARSGTFTSGGRPRRPCPYCGKDQSSLVRHLTRTHRNEQAVKDALKLPKRDQYLIFDRIKKEGIFLKNLKLQEQGLPLLRERGHSASNLKMCDNCHGFYSRRILWAHRQRCALVTGTFGGPARLYNNQRGGMVTENKPRPKRPCVYCGQLFCLLRRHLKQKHGEEDAVKAALELPKAEQAAVFNRIRKEGIYKENVSRKEQGLPLLRERQQDGFDTGLRKCDGCQGFYSSRRLTQHQKHCTFLTKPLEISLTASESRKKADLLDPSKQFQIVMKRMRGDALGQLCDTDPFIKLLGKTLCEENVAVKKINVKRKMRLLAQIVSKMRSLSCDESIMAESLLEKDGVKALINVVESLNMKEAIAFKTTRGVLNKLAKIAKTLYTQLGENHNLEKVDKFTAELNKNWLVTFEGVAEEVRKKRKEYYRAKCESKSVCLKGSGGTSSSDSNQSNTASTSTAQDPKTANRDEKLLRAYCLVKKL